MSIEFKFNASITANNRSNNEVIAGDFPGIVLVLKFVQ